MTSEEFSALFDGARHTVFRLETLQTYAVPGADASLRAFREGTPRPVRSVETSPWLRRIAVTTAHGVEWSRVRVVEHPLTEYTRWAILAYVESQAAGEQVGISERPLSGPDFWLIDANTPYARAVVMHYSPAGELEARELVTDLAPLAGLVTRRDAARAMAVGLNEFLARMDARAGA